MNFLKNLLTDKSFWTAVVAIATSVATSLHVPAGSVAQITTIISAAGVFIAYIVGNTVLTAAQIKADGQVKATQIVKGQTTEGK